MKFKNIPTYNPYEIWWTTCYLNFTFKTSYDNFFNLKNSIITEDTESGFAQTTIPTNIHTANRIFSNIILMADKQNIPKGKTHSNCRLLPEDIVCKITQRNNIRRANTCDPALQLLNEEITSDIQKHKQNIWKEHLGQHTHSLEDHTWSIQQSTITHTKHIHNIQQQNSNYTHTRCQLFHQTIHKHCQARNTQNKQTH